MNTKIKNFHVIKASYSGPTASGRGSRVVLTSERFEQSKVIPYNSSMADTCEIAEEWLLQNGFAVVGHADGKGCYYVISSTFKPLKP